MVGWPDDDNIPFVSAGISDSAPSSEGLGDGVDGSSIKGKGQVSGGDGVLSCIDDVGFKGVVEAAVPFGK